MKVVYPFVNSPCEDLELLLSVKSLSRLHDQVSDVIIVGDMPATFEQIRSSAAVPVRLIMTPKVPHANPVRDVINKVMIAARAMEPSDDFLYMHDDVLVIGRDVKISHEHRGALSHCEGYWGRVIRHTLDRLVGQEGLCYECHSPIMINAGLFNSTFDILPRKDVLLKSAYLNKKDVREYHQERGIDPVRGENHKMRITDELTQDVLLEYANRTDIVSLHHKVKTVELTKCLEEDWINAM